MMEKLEYKKKCLWCGNEFSIFVYDRRKVRKAYCSVKCQRNAENKQRDEYIQRKRLMQILNYEKKEVAKPKSGDPYEWLKRVDKRIKENGGYYYAK